MRTPVTVCETPEGQRTVMRSIARLTYEQVQAAADGRLDDTTDGLADTVIQPLYGAFRALAKARRHELALEIEREVSLENRRSHETVGERDLDTLGVSRVPRP